MNSGQLTWRLVLTAWLGVLVSVQTAPAESKALEERLRKIEEALLRVQRSQKDFLDLAAFQAGEERVKVGQEAPVFEVKTLDGKDVRLVDFRGKFVLLDFWSTWCPPSKEETLQLKSVQEKFKSQTNVVFVGLSLDNQAEKSREFLEDHSISRVEGFLGNWGEDIFRHGPSRKYGVNAIPSLWLIGPDGRVLAKNLRGAAVEKALTEALTIHPKP